MVLPQETLYTSAYAPGLVSLVFSLGSILLPFEIVLCLRVKGLEEF